MSSVSFGTSTNPSFYFDSDTGYLAANTSTPDYLLTIEQRIGEGGIGIGEPGETRLAVHGSIKASGSIDSYTGLDIAERYPLNPQCHNEGTCPEPGDLVSITDNMSVEKTTLPYDRNLIGVVPNNSAIIMGGGLNASTSIPVALAGRTAVKVSLEGGPIESGDSLTSASSTPGLAMKATRTGRVIGIALESYDKEGVGTITAFLNAGWQSLSVEEDSQGYIVDSEINEIKKGLTSLGLEISQDESLNAEKVQAEIIEIGKLSLTNSVLEENGVTMTDRATGELYCLYVWDNEIKTKLGECKNSSQ
jgi:hypothetical protein